MRRLARRRSGGRRGSLRRKVETARASIQIINTGGSVNVARVLDTWFQDMGLSAAGGLPGLTVGGLRYRLTLFNASAINTLGLTWGFIVVPEMITSAADFSPAAKQHLDWMEYGRGSFTVPANTQTPVVGNGDEGFRTTRSKRVVREIEDALFFVVESTSTVTVTCDVSCAVFLP